MNDQANDSWKGKGNFSMKNGGSPFNDAEILAVQLSHSMLGAVGLIENVVVILAVLRKRIAILSVRSNRFVLSLAIADAVACIATIAAVVCITTGREVQHILQRHSICFISQCRKSVAFDI